MSSTHNQNPTQRQEFARELIQSLCPLALAHFKKTVHSDLKDDMSPVTWVDKQIENQCRQAIAKAYPLDGILGEEEGHLASRSGFTWIIDPIDGTRSFITGHPLFGMMLACMSHHQTQTAIVAIPTQHEIYSASYHQGSTLNQQSIHVSTQTSLSQAQLYINEAERIWRQEPEIFALLMSCALSRRFSHDCVPYTLLASGHIDALVDYGLEAYDFLPVALIVQEAGGVITDWHGQALHEKSDGRIAAAATPALHAELLQVLNSHS